MQKVPGSIQDISKKTEKCVVWPNVSPIHTDKEISSIEWGRIYLSVNIPNTGLFGSDTKELEHFFTQPKSRIGDVVQNESADLIQSSH